MRILITGVHGFVGGNLVKALKKDNEIYDNIFRNNNSDYLQKARKYGHFTGYKN